MNELIKAFFKCVTCGILKQEDELTQKLLHDIDQIIQERDLSLNSESGELWQQIQDFRKVE